MSKITENSVVTHHVYGYVKSNIAEKTNTSALLSFGVEKIIKNDTDVSFAQFLATLNPADTIVIPSINHLGSNFKAILNSLTLITEKQVSIVILNIPDFDTRNDHTFKSSEILPLTLRILSSIYDTDKHMHKTRQAEGIAAAKNKGKAWGRKRIEISEEFEEIMRQRSEGTITLAAAAERLGVSISTFKRREKEWKQGKREHSAGK